MCHAQNLFHGLLKPSNLMVSPEGQVRILDLGIGSLLAETEGESLVDTMSSANSMASGLDCASPESIMDPNNLTPIGDQYSLGCVLYFCLTGRYPFPDGTAVDKMMAHQMREPEAVNDLNPEIPSALAEVVDRLMQKTPAARFPSTHEVIEALQPLAGPPPVSARPGPGRKSRSERRLVSPPLGDTPRPERRLPSSGVLNDPSRLSSRGAHSRQQMPGSQPDPETPGSFGARALGPAGRGDGRSLPRQTEAWLGGKAGAGGRCSVCHHCLRDCLAADLEAVLKFHQQGSGNED